MPIGDSPDKEEIRNTGTYRAAVWLTRVCFVWGLVLAGGTCVFRPSWLVLILTLLVGIPLVVWTMVLLHRAGARFVGRDLFYRDVFGPRR
jgi:cytosine/uracil/thiamine/allantoin permease